MGHRIVEADPSGIGYRHGLRAGDEILTIGGEKVVDEIDYQALTAERHMWVRVQGGGALMALRGQEAFFAMPFAGSAGSAAFATSGGVAFALVFL